MNNEASFSPNGAAIAAPDVSIEAEQSVLAAMLTTRRSLDAARAALRPSSFHSAFHQVIFGAILAMRARGEPADFVSVRNELISQGKLDAAGGAVYLDALADAAPPIGGIEQAVHSLADKSRGQPTARSGPAARKPISERTVDLADISPPDELPLLFGPYLLQGAAHWLTGATGLGKSTLLFNLSCALAEGTSLWGIDCPQTRVLYADMESGDVGRAHKVERLYQGAPRVRDWLSFLREPVKLPDELDELLAYVKGRGIGLVVFDTARRCFSVKDENDNAEVYRQVVPTLDALKQAGVATLTLGHPSKNGNGSARGAGAQEDAGDVNLTLTMHRGEVTDTDGVIALRVTKNRLLGLGVPPLFLRRTGDDQFTRVDDAQDGPAETRGEAPSARDRCAADILEYLGASGPARHGLIINAMKERGHTEGTAKKTVSWLQQQERRIENDVDAGGYVLTARQSPP